MFEHSVFFQAEDGIRDLVRSRGLGDVYKRQHDELGDHRVVEHRDLAAFINASVHAHATAVRHRHCLLYTSDAADERSSVDLGGRRIIKKKNNSTLSQPTQ